jgi:hypothetical protein
VEGFSPPPADQQLVQLLGQQAELLPDKETYLQTASAILQTLKSFINLFDLFNIFYLTCF